MGSRDYRVTVQVWPTEAVILDVTHSMLLYRVSQDRQTPSLMLAAATAVLLIEDFEDCLECLEP